MADSYGMTSGTGLDRLADFAASRRVELSMDVEELARRMGVSDKTVRRIETGQSVKRDTYAKLEHELGWVAGTARRLRDQEVDRPELETDQPARALDDTIPPGWTPEEEERWRLAKEMLPRLLGREPLDHGELTRQRYRWMQDEYDRLQEIERTMGPVTRGDESKRDRAH